jgi:hypothetical protein
MPTHDSARLHEEEGCAPVPPGLGQDDPEQSIPPAESWTLTAAFQGVELLPERQVFKRDRSVSAARQSDRPEEYDKGLQHAVSCRTIDAASSHCRRSGFGERQG